MIQTMNQKQTHKFTIDGQMPNLNDFIRAERTQFRSRTGKFMTKGATMKKEYQHNATISIRRDLRRLKVENPVLLKYSFYEPNKKRDHDNVASFAMKVIQDALVEVGVLKNDGWKEIVGFECQFYVDAQKPRIEVEIIEIQSKAKEDN